MIDYETFCQIQHDRRQGLTLAQIAAARGLHRHTVAHWLARDEYRRRHTRPRPSKLDAFKPDILRWLHTHPLSARQVFQRLREQGYTGGYSILCDYIGYSGDSFHAFRRKSSSCSGGFLPRIPA